jgi:hypothetical protein
MKRAVNFADPAEVRAFLGTLRDHALDAIAAGEDATRAPRERVFSRHEARRRIHAAEKAILALVEPAMGALPEASEPAGGNHG